MKKTITLLLTLLIIFGTVFTTFVFAYDEDEDEGYKIYETKHYVYTIKDGKAIIGYYKGKQSTVKVPSKIEGKLVVGFGRYPDVEMGYRTGGFFNNKYVKKIVFPKSIKNIYEMSVGKCKNLKSVIIKSKIKEISDYLFYKCSKLKKVSLPSTIKVIGDEAFRNTGLKGNFTVGKNVKQLYGDSFQGTKITKFSVAKGNRYFSSKDGVLYNKDKTKLICYPCAKSAKTFKTPKKTKRISLLSFKGIRKLKTVYISNNTQNIETHAFMDCPKLSKIVIDTNNSIVIEEDAFMGCNKISKLLLKTDKNITIGTRAFDDCPLINVITIPKNVLKIGKNAFGYKWKKSGNSYKHVRIKGFTIKGYKGTAAEKYAKKNKFKFVALKK